MPYIWVVGELAPNPCGYMENCNFQGGLPKVQSFLQDYGSTTLSRYQFQCHSRIKGATCSKVPQVIVGMALEILNQKLHLRFCLLLVSFWNMIFLYTMSMTQRAKTFLMLRLHCLYSRSIEGDVVHFLWDMQHALCALRKNHGYSCVHSKC